MTSKNYREELETSLNQLNKLSPLIDKIVSVLIWLLVFSVWSPVAAGTFIAISTLAPYIRDLTTEHITIFSVFTATAANLMVLFFGFCAEFGSLFLQFLIELKKRELAKLEDDGVSDNTFIKKDVVATIRDSNFWLKVFCAGHFAIIWVYVAFNFASEPSGAMTIDPNDIFGQGDLGGSSSAYIMIPQNPIEWILITLMAGLGSAASMYAMPYIVAIATFNLARALGRQER